MMLEAFFIFLFVAAFVSAWRFVGRDEPHNEGGRGKLWFQLHLSTTFVLMWLASLILWANLREGHGIDNYDPQQAEICFSGWPCMWRYGNGTPDMLHYSVFSVFINVFTAIFLLSSAASFLENLIRWRKRKGALIEILFMINPLVAFALLLFLGILLLDWLQQFASQRP